MHSFIYYFSFTSIPFLIVLIYFTIKQRRTIRKSKLLLALIILLYVLSVSFIYSRFIERNLITTQTTPIEVGFKSRIVVIADLHLGIYKNANFLERTVAKINKLEDIDAILIPGDLTYHPQEELVTLFTAMSDIKFPIYAVLGNHDSEKPGPPLRDELKAALSKSGVTFLHNSSAIIKGTNIKVLGLGDKWADEDDISQIDNFSKEDNLIVLTHNPDTTLEYKNSIPDLTIAGHTHGGQIRIPFIYKYAIPCEGDFDQGLYQGEFGQTFVTSGLGEVGLPMRLGVPPVIDVLELN